jgi:hypothetical protein
MECSKAVASTHVDVGTRRYESEGAVNFATLAGEAHAQSVTEIQ